VELRIDSGGQPLSIALGDFNSDGRLDIAKSTGRIILNDGKFFEPGWSGSVTEFLSPSGEWAVESSDVDSDGALDLLVAVPFAHPDPIALFYGRGDGTFTAGEIYQVGSGVAAIRTADMDGDGILDIVAGNRCTADVTILKGLGNRRFEHLETIRAYSVEDIAIADLNRDGHPDVLGAGLALWVLLSGAESSLSDPRSANPAGILPAEGVYINEIMPLNKKSYKNPEGRTPDWLEIHNHAVSGLDLSGWKLRQYSRQGGEDDWSFPAGTTIDAMGHLVVFCDGGESHDGLQASFSLDSSGESAALVRPSGEVADRVDFPAVPEDVSYARFVDGARYLCYNPAPTMGGPNVRPTNLKPSVAAENPYLTGDGSRINVTVRTFDDIGIAHAEVYFRLQGEPQFSQLQLTDDGLNGDGAQGDGVLGATLPALMPDSTVLMYFRVVDLEGEVTTNPDTPGAEANLLRVAAPPGARGLRISEALPDNQTPFQNGADWLEIANCASQPLSLSGLALTKTYFDPGEDWRFPEGRILAPGEALVLRCSGKDDPGLLHPSFKLDKDGDGVLLVEADAPRRIVDSLRFGPLEPNTSFGLATCGAEPAVLPVPTPGTVTWQGPTLFVRGDANADFSVDLPDAVFQLLYMFLGGTEPPCLRAADSDDSGSLDLSDPIFTLNHLFLGGPAVPEPYPFCGVDSTPDELTCGTYPSGCR